MTKTAKQVKADLVAAGITQKAWAEARGYRPEDVTRILNGQWKATRGKGHEIAVALGMKAAPAKA